MRHRRDVTFSDTSSAARVVAAEAQSDTEKSDEHSRTAKRPRLEGQPAAVALPAAAVPLRPEEEEAQGIASAAHDQAQLEKP